MKRNCLKATRLIMIFTEIHTVQESICVSCAAEDSARQDCWKFICEFTLERNPTTATFVGKTLDNQVTWTHMSGSTLERDLTSVRTVGRRLLTRAQETDTSKNVFLSLCRHNEIIRSTCWFQWYIFYSKTSWVSWNIWTEVRLTF